MKAIKHILAFALSLMMIFSTVIASGVMTASAIAGGGLQQSSFRSYGADLSFWNVGGSTLNYSLVDFAKMKADGCEFVILRIGFEGSSSRTNTLDSAFVEYYNRARAAGMPLGVYFYSLATTYSGAVEDANWVANKIEAYDMYFEYPIYYDVEDSNQTSLGSSAMESLCLGWCETLEARGYFPGIYGGGSQVIDKLSSSFKAKYDLWYPRVKVNGHGTQYDPTAYDRSSYCSMWQYAWYDYEYDGIGLDMLDVNVCYKDYPAIMSQYGYNNCGTSTAKTNLGNIISAAANARHYNYSTSQLTTLRTAYDNAVSVYNSASSTEDNFTAAATALNNALNPYFGVISTGKSYTYNATNRTDGWADDGKKMTDGVGGTIDGGSYTYSGWGEGTGAQIVIDLGSGTSHNGYRVYAASNSEWGISSVTGIEVSVSNDGTNFTKVASTYQTTLLGTVGTWNAYYITAWSASSRSERFVKISVSTGGNHTWIEEVEVGTGEMTVQNAFYIDAVDQYIYAGDCHVFTSAMGTVTTSNANHSWCNSVVAKWNSSKNAYVVTKTINGTGTDTESVTLASDEILVAAHGWEGGTVSDPVIGSMANYNAVGALNVGDSFTLNGVDLNNKTVSVAAHGSYSVSGSSDHTHVSGGWVVVTPAGIGTTGLREQRCTVCGEVISQATIPALDEDDVQNSGIMPDNAKTFWVTHVNDSTVEGAGVITTSSDANIINAWAWRLVVIFKPVSGLSGVYEISEIYDHLSFGAEEATVIAAHANSSIPDGGFIYHINYGNDWPSIDGYQDGEINYTSANCNSAIADAMTWQVGDQFTFYGIDPVYPTVSTSTPGVNWYEDTYVCTSYYAPYAPESEEPDTTVKYLLGDINMDGAIDQYDYILAKRAHFNTITFNENQKILGDMDEDGDNDQYDYILIKRIHFKNYTLEKYVDIKI